MAIKCFASAVVLATALAASTAHAQTGGAFGRIGIGGASNDLSSQGSYNLYGGYRWAMGRNFALGLEAGYSDLGSKKDRYINDYGRPYVTGEERTDRGVKSVSLGINARWDISDKFYLEAHGGYARYRYRSQGRSEYYTPYTTYRDKWRDTLYSTGYYAGLGVGYNITPQIGVLVTYDHFNPKYWNNDYTVTRLNTDVWGAALEFRF